MPGLGIDSVKATPEQCAKALEEQRSVKPVNGWKLNQGVTRKTYAEVVGRAMNLEKKAQELGSYETAVAKAGAAVPKKAGTEYLDQKAVRESINQPVVREDINKFDAIASSKVVPMPTGGSVVIPGPVTKTETQPLPVVKNVNVIPPPPDNPPTPPPTPVEPPPDNPPPVTPEVQ